MLSVSSVIPNFSILPSPSLSNQPRKDAISSSPYAPATAAAKRPSGLFTPKNLAANAVCAPLAILSLVSTSKSNPVKTLSSMLFNNVLNAFSTKSLRTRAAGPRRIKPPAAVPNAVAKPDPAPNKAARKPVPNLPKPSRPELRINAC